MKACPSIQWSLVEQMLFVGLRPPYEDTTCVVAARVEYVVVVVADLSTRFLVKSRGNLLRA